MTSRWTPIIQGIGISKAIDKSLWTVTLRKLFFHWCKIFLCCGWDLSSRIIKTSLIYSVSRKYYFVSKVPSNLEYRLQQIFHNSMQLLIALLLHRFIVGKAIHSALMTTRAFPVVIRKMNNKDSNFKIGNENNLFAHKYHHEHWP